MGKRWLEGCAVLGVKSMRMNSPRALGPQIRPNAVPNGGDGYPRNLEIIPLMNAAIESYKEMADFGGSLGIHVTFENHWGLAADPMNLRIILDTINHPYCSMTPDFCNWEHEYMLFNGLKALVPLMNAAIESYKEMADFGGNLGIKVTFENHWGLAADPMNIRIMLDMINHPYCEASPDFCNWEHEYMLFNGLKALAPYSHTNVHAKYWDRWGDKNDVQRSTRIMLAGGFKGTFALEYEAGPLNGIEGALYLFKEVMAALSSPVPVS